MLLINNCTKLKMDGWDRCPRICVECERVVLVGYAPHWRYTHSGGLAASGQWECWHALCWRMALLTQSSEDPPRPVFGVPRRDQIFAWDFGPSLGGS